MEEKTFIFSFSVKYFSVSLQHQRQNTQKARPKLYPHIWRKYIMQKNYMIQRKGRKNGHKTVTPRKRIKWRKYLQKRLL